MFQWNAMILAGGRAVRLGGVDKPGIVVRGRTLLDASLAATRGADRCVIVGPQRDGLPDRVRSVVDDPPHSGTPYAVEVGLAALAGSPAEFVAVVAADQPRADDALAVVLRAVRPSSTAEAWVATKPGGQARPLLAVYRTEALARAIAEERAERGSPGRKLRNLLPRLAVQPVHLFGYLCADIDTPIDLLEHGVDPAFLVPASVA